MNQSTLHSCHKYLSDLRLVCPLIRVSKNGCSFPPPVSKSHQGTAELKSNKPTHLSTQPLICYQISVSGKPWMSLEIASLLD